MLRVEEAYPSLTAVYCTSAPVWWPDDPAVSEPFSISLSFTGHRQVLVRGGSGRTESLAIPAGSGGMTGGEEVAWIRVPTASECVEFRPSATLRRSICEELGVPAACEFANLTDIVDPVLWSASARFRAHALAGWRLDDLEADGMADSLVRAMVVRCLGGRLPRATTRRLDDRRLARVVDHVEQHLASRMSIDDLAQAAALSRYHFLRSFKATTGLTPQKYVLGRRMQRARDLLAGTTLGLPEVARRIGYSNGHYFRRAFSQFFGRPPGEWPRP